MTLSHCQPLFLSVPITSLPQANRSLKFLQKNSHLPFLMVLSTPASHSPWTAAPHYKSAYSTIKAPRTGSFNVHGKVSGKATEVGSGLIWLISQALLRPGRAPRACHIYTVAGHNMAHVTSLLWYPCWLPSFFWAVFRILVITCNLVNGLALPPICWWLQTDLKQEASCLTPLRILSVSASGSVSLWHLPPPKIMQLLSQCRLFQVQT